MAAPELVEAVRVIEAELERDLFQLLSFIVQPVRCAQERDINVVLCGHACNFLHAFAQVIRTYVKRIGTLLHAVEQRSLSASRFRKRVATRLTASTAGVLRIPECVCLRIAPYEGDG